MEFIYIFVVGYGLLMIVIMVVFYKRYKNQKKALEGLSAELNAQNVKSGQSYKAEYEGSPYEYRYYAGSRNRPSYFKIFIDCPSDGQFEIGKENRFDRFFKNLGIAVEIQTGDSTFDEKVYIKSNTVGFTERYFSDAAKHHAVLQLLMLGFTGLKFDGKRIELTKSPFQLTKDFSSNFILDAIQWLITLTKELPETIPEALILGRSDWKVKRVIIFLITTLIMCIGAGSLVGTFAYYKPLDGWQVFMYSLKYCVIGFIIFTALAIQFLKGRSSSHYELMGCLVIALSGILMSGYGCTSVYNGYIDTSMIEEHIVSVIDKRISRDDDSTNYYIKVRSWRKSKGFEEFSVSSSLYHSVNEGRSKVNIRTKEGNLGFEWLVSIHKVS